jgi:holo-[acyl-carrier protein] synthase
VIFGIGVDAVNCERMDEKRMTPYIIKRLFNKIEVENLPISPKERQVYLASRFAAKEALVKALGEGFRFCSPRSIAVVNDEKGKPSFSFDKEVENRLPQNLSQIHLSITHEESVAIAFVVLEVSDASK